MAVFGNAISLTLASVTSRALLFAREGFLAASLGPSSYGLWVQMTTILSYALHLPMGYQNILSRDVPFHLGRGDKNKLSAIVGSAKFVTVSTALIAAIIIIAVSFFEASSFVLQSLYTTLAATIIIQQFNGYQSVLLRAEERFVDFSIGLVLISVIGLIGAVITVEYLGILGPVVFQCIALFIASAYWMKRVVRCHKISLSDNYFYAIRLWPQAFPLFVGGAVGFFISSLDRLLIVSFYPKEDAGLYGFAFVLTQSVYLVTTPVVNIFNTRMMRDYGLTNTPKTLLPYLLLFSLILPIFVVFFLGVLCLSAGVITIIWFPQYTASVGILKTLSLGLAPLLMASGVQMLLVAKNREKLVMWGNMAFATIQIIIYCTSVYFDFTIMQIARTVVIFYIFYSAYYLALFSFTENGGFVGVFHYFKSVYLPIAMYSVIVFWIVDIELNIINKYLFISIKVLIITAVAIDFYARWMDVLRFLTTDCIKTLVIDGRMITRNAAK